MTRLRIAADLSLPPEAVTEKIGFLGRTGGGKSYAAQKLAEELHAAGSQFVALDPVGIWWGLRLAKNGRDAGIALPVLGGLRGDVPLEPGAGKVIADLVVDKGISAVVDVSQFESDADKARFAKDFAARFFFRKKAAPSPVHLFVEEAQEFVPQNPQRDEAHMLHAFHRLIKLGRNFGIGVSLISQRPQEVNKKALNQTELLFAFQMTGPQERKAVQGWIAEKGVDEDIAGELPKLKRGNPHAWSPAWLQISRVVAIGEKWTFDASSTPKVGDAKKVRELAPIDIEQLGAEIKATVERAKADDPKELKRIITLRDREIRELQKYGSGKLVDKPVVDQTAIDRAVASALAEERARVKSEAIQIRRVLAKVNAAAHEIADSMDAPIARLDTALIEPRGLPVAPLAPVRRAARSAEPPAAARRVEPRIVPASSDGDLTPSKMRLLNALAALELLGFQQARTLNVAFFAGYTENGHFNNMKGELRTAGLVAYPTPGFLSLTDEGRARASAPAHPIVSLDDLHNAWLNKISPSEGKLLRELIREYPNAVEKAELAARCGYTVNGHFNNMVGHLKTLGAVEYPRPGLAAATDVLFPEGLI